MRLVSILGDSLSTFEGYNPEGYAVYYDKDIQKKNNMNSVYDTWWAKVNQALQAFLCVNNSYSGSRVSGKVFPSGQSEERICNLRTKEYTPDYILVYLGYNDFGNGIQIRKTTRQNLLREEADTFLDAYDNMIKTIKAYYPDTIIICGTLMRTILKNDDYWIFPEYFKGVPLDEYNDVIRKVARKYHCYLADVADMGIRYETLDGSHGTSAGHATIANAWIQCLGSFGLIEPSIETCIKMYHANMNDDMHVYNVFKSLTKEKVLLPFEYVYFLERMWETEWENQTIIPIFTSPNEFRMNEQVQLQSVFLKNHINDLRSVNKTVVVNPFSEADKQFIIPATAIDEFFIPILNSQN